MPRVTCSYKFRITPVPDRRFDCQGILRRRDLSNEAHTRLVVVVRALLVGVVRVVGRSRGVVVNLVGAGVTNDDDDAARLVSPSDGLTATALAGFPGFASRTKLGMPVAVPLMAAPLLCTTGSAPLYNGGYIAHA